MLAFTVVAGVAAVGASVLIMRSEASETATRREDVRYLNARSDYDFGSSADSREVMASLADERLATAIKDPRATVQFFQALTPAQVKNAARHRGTAAAVLALGEMQKGAFCRLVRQHAMDEDVDPAVAAAVMASAPFSKADVAGLPLPWPGVLRALLQLYDASPKDRPAAKQQLDLVLSTRDDVAEAFSADGRGFLADVSHDALANVVHRYADANALYQSPAFRSMTLADVRLMASRRSEMSVETAALLRTVLKGTTAFGATPGLVVEYAAACAPGGQAVVPLSVGGLTPGAEDPISPGAPVLRDGFRVAVDAPGRRLVVQAPSVAEARADHAKKADAARYYRDGATLARADEAARLVSALEAGTLGAVVPVRLVVRRAFDVEQEVSVRLTLTSAAS